MKGISENITWCNLRSHGRFLQARSHACVTVQLLVVLVFGQKIQDYVRPVALHLVYITKIFYILASTPKLHFIIISYLKYYNYVEKEQSWVLAG